MKLKWWLIAWREIRWEVFLDRASLLRTGIFVVIPLFFVLSNRGVPPGPGGDFNLIGLALQSVFFPALSGVALIAATFSAEKENGTLVPLLAAPIRRFLSRRRCPCEWIVPPLRLRPTGRPLAGCRPPSRVPG